MDLEEEDIKLLNELGLDPSDSVVTIEQKIGNLNMRQLDRLKLMLDKITKERDIFSKNTKNGIRNNDLKAFAEAVVILARVQMKKHN
ncbi:MAG TPA: hypothetical protein VN739_00180 [Nitrososphaerales archaeon]|nr:hypothetical protein [Nitrososphaerales archaeon]